MIQRRKQKRVKISFPIECDCLSHRNYFCSVSRDLSLTGIQTVNNSFIPKDSIVKININLIDRFVSLKANVIWSIKKRASERYSTGLEFIETTQAHKRHITHFLHNLTA